MNVPQPKFNLGDKIWWTGSQGTPVKVEIRAAIIYVSSARTSVRYGVTTDDSQEREVPEAELFWSEMELIENMLRKMKGKKDI